MKLFDSHVHLQDEKLAPYLETIFAESEKLGISGWLSSGLHPSDWDSLENLSQENPKIYPAYGVHPWYLNNLEENFLEKLREKLKNPRSLIGEIGLDLLIKTPFDKQLEIFKAQWDLSFELKKNVIIHLRKGESAFLKILEEKNPPHQFLLHNYLGVREVTEKFLKYDAFFSFGGALTQENNKKILKNLEIIALEKILIETDAPSMPPLNLVVIFKALSKLKKISEEELAFILEKNRERFLGEIYTL